MKRDLRKYIDEYSREYLDKGKGTRKGQFYFDDFQQISIMSTGKNREPLLVRNALYAGFMVGYKAAKNEARRATR